VDVDTADSAVGVTKVRLGGEGVLEWGELLDGRGVLYSWNGLQDACLFGGERCCGNIAAIMCGVR